MAEKHSTEDLLTAHAAFEAETIVTEEGETIADLRQALDLVCDPLNWKKPWSAAVHHSLVGRVSRAVEFFHADRPTVDGTERLTGRVVMPGRGYQT